MAPINKTLLRCRFLPIFQELVIPFFTRIFHSLFLSIAALALALAAPATMAAPTDPPSLSSNAALATAGYYRLLWKWRGGEKPVFELQESANAGFANPATLYVGPDRAMVVSGRRDGERHYRIRARLGEGETTPWSRPVTVAVRHHSLSRALAFFAAGALVFLAILVFIVAASRHDRKGLARGR